LEAKQARLAELQEARQVLRDAADPNRDYRRYLEREAVKVRQQIADEDFGPQERKLRVLDKQTLAAKWELDKVREERRKKQEAWKWERMGLAEQAGRVAGRVIQAYRSYLTSCDFSSVLNQGAFVVAGHPLVAAKALPGMFRAFWSRKAAFEDAQQLANRPNADFQRQSGLTMTSTIAGPNLQEEGYLGEWTKHVPIVAGSERAYVAFLNRVRADLFDSMTATLMPGGQPTLAEGKLIANFVNATTGRGNLGSWQASAHPLAQVFFAPRFFVSRLQLLFGQPIWKPEVGGTWRTRLAIAKEYARSLLGIGLLYSSAMLAHSLLPGKDDEPFIEWSPFSTSFLKIRIGNHFIDPWAGVTQMIVLGHKVFGGKEKIEGGGMVPLAGSEKPYGGMTIRRLLHNFQDKKFAPIPSLIMDVVTQENVMGQPVTPLGALGERAMPIAVSDVVSALRDFLGAQGQGKPAAGVATGLLAMWGARVYTRAAPLDDQVAKAAHALSGPKDLRKVDDVDWAKMKRANSVLNRSGRSQAEIEGLLDQHLRNIRVKIPKSRDEQKQRLRQIRQLLAQ
jgi:hypothetical protein